MLGTASWTLTLLIPVVPCSDSYTSTCISAGGTLQTAYLAYLVLLSSSSLQLSGPQSQNQIKALDKRYTHTDKHKLQWEGLGPTHASHSSWC